MSALLRTTDLTARFRADRSPRPIPLFGLPMRAGDATTTRSAPLSPAELTSTNLMPASGHQDHTTSPSASRAIRQRRISVHRIPPRVRDDREPPLQRNGTAGVLELIWVKREAEYFCEKGWTG